MRRRCLGHLDGSGTGSPNTPVLWEWGARSPDAGVLREWASAWVPWDREGPRVQTSGLSGRVGIWETRAAGAGTSKLSNLPFLPFTEELEQGDKRLESLNQDLMKKNQHLQDLATQLVKETCSIALEVGPNSFPALLGCTQGWGTGAPIQGLAHPLPLLPHPFPRQYWDLKDKVMSSETTVRDIEAMVKNLQQDIKKHVELQVEMCCSETKLPGMETTVENLQRDIKSQYKWDKKLEKQLAKALKQVGVPPPPFPGEAGNPDAWETWGLGGESRGVLGTGRRWGRAGCLGPLTPAYRPQMKKNLWRLWLCVRNKICPGPAEPAAPAPKKPRSESLGPDLDQPDRRGEQAEGGVWLGVEPM